VARRHRKSKKNVVQVNPDATLNYVTGILTGASDYITGILEGANLYNSWVQQEMSLEGTPIGDYKEDSLRKWLDEFKAKDYDGYVRLMADPLGYLQAVKSVNEANYKNLINEIVSKTNYGRLVNTDKAMINAGKVYREQVPSLIKSKNVETGLTMLQNYAPYSTKVIDKINGIMTSALKYNM
jgi:hypothetical protein